MSIESRGLDTNGVENFPRRIDFTLTKSVKKDYTENEATENEATLPRAGYLNPSHNLSVILLFF